MQKQKGVGEPTLLESDSGLLVGRLFDGALGTKISLDSSASVPDGSKASATTTVKGTSSQPGLVEEYFGFSGVNLFTPGPQVFQDYGAMSGENVNSGLSASNNFEDKASVNAEIQSGTITGEFNFNLFTNLAAENEGIGNLIAAQNDNQATNVNIVNGNKLTLTAKASTAADLEASKRTVVSNPSDVSFYNIARVDYISQPGIPFVDQNTLL